jgi:hypothetical protein
MGGAPQPAMAGAGMGGGMASGLTPPPPTR